MKSLKLTSFVLAFALLLAGCAHSADTPSSTPQILRPPLVYIEQFTGYSGRGPEGLVVAVWDEGTIMRASSLGTVGKDYQIGVLDGPLLTSVKKRLSEIASRPESDSDDLAEVDQPTYSLGIRSGDKVRTWRAEISRDSADLVPATLAELMELTPNNVVPWGKIAESDLAAQVPISWRR